MPPIETIALFLAADLLLKLSPGPDIALVIARGATQGKGAAIASAAGVAAAGLVQIPAVLLGLAILIAASPALFAAIKLIGALYLIWLGLRALRNSVGESATPDWSNSGLAHHAFRQGMITNLLNPKVTVFLVAFLPQFASPSVGALWWQLLFFGCWMKLNGFLLLSSVGVLAARARHWLMRNPAFVRWQEGVLGLGLLSLGLWLIADTDAAAAPLPEGRALPR